MNTTSTSAPDTLSDIHHLFNIQGYVLINTHTTQTWVLDLLAQQFGNIQGSVFWEKYFTVEYDPLKPSASTSLARTATEFPLHTDGSFETIPPKCIALHCIESDIDGFGISLLVDGWKVIEKLSPVSRSTLLNSRFQFRRNAEGKEASINAPIFELVEQSYKMRYRNDNNFNLVSLSQDSESALNEFQQLISLPELVVSVQLKVGDVLIVNNYRMLHGRTPLSGKQKRTLQRLWIG